MKATEDMGTHQRVASTVSLSRFVHVVKKLDTIVIVPNNYFQKKLPGKSNILKKLTRQKRSNLREIN